MVFGKVIDGFSILDDMERIGSRSGSPNAACIISDSGEIKK